MPDGTPLEQTTRVAQALGRHLSEQPEVTNYQIYAGTSGPYNFNGLVRHYFLRRKPNQADIQVNLLSRQDRKVQSHEIARRLRPELDKIAQPSGHASRLLKFLLVRRYCRPWWRKSTGPITRVKSNWRPRLRRSFNKRLASWMWTGTLRARR